MKKLLSLIVLASLTLVGQAANFTSQDFLNVQAVYVTNTLNITNLTATGTIGTNLAGTTFTNNGSRVVVSTASQSGVNTLHDVSLWARADGSPAYSMAGTTNTTFGAVVVGDATLSVTMTGGSGADSAVTFVIVPVWDGVNQSTQAGDAWTFSFTAVASTTVTLSTNVPTIRFPGAGKLKLQRIVNADTDASSQVIITDIKLNGYIP